MMPLAEIIELGQERTVIRAFIAVLGILIFALAMLVVFLGRQQAERTEAGPRVIFPVLWILLALAVYSAGQIIGGIDMAAGRDIQIPGTGPAALARQAPR